MPQVVVTRYVGRRENSLMGLHHPLQEIKIGDAVVKTSYFGTLETLDRELDQVKNVLDDINISVETKVVDPDWSYQT